MTYLLDTNIISAILKGENEKVKENIQKAAKENKEICIDGISYYEVKRGLLSTQSAMAIKQMNDFNLLCEEYGLIWLYTQSVFDVAAEIYADLKQKGTLIGGDADILIASVAKTRELILVTDNTKHFQRIQDLRIENWLS